MAKAAAMIEPEIVEEEVAVINEKRMWSNPMLELLGPLKDAGLTGVKVLWTFFERRVQPLMARVHPLFRYTGAGDPMRMSPEVLTSAEMHYPPLPEDGAQRAANRAENERQLAASQERKKARAAMATAQQNGALLRARLPRRRRLPTTAMMMRMMTTMMREMTWGRGSTRCWAPASAPRRRRSARGDGGCR
ncbi:hypothetical protein BAE44_0014998 [Dichanthelium oligosanthes]|uniref:Uncharacterized protein n=1 Tax=Dichanthelium oligosanthes TaxID=888268 RepID=A0A1E5VG14_9POAL|nr:hypothetical protein BAE44_0014998 [Dichanthelium oligosanthes]